MQNSTRYTKELLSHAVSISRNFSDVLRNLNLEPRGGSFTYISRKIKSFEIDTSHFIKTHSESIKKAWESGRYKRRDPSQILCVSNSGRREMGEVLRKALISIGRKYECYECGISHEYNHRPIVLEVDHINRDWEDNRPENIQFLCPNCHSQKTKKEYFKKKKILLNPNWRTLPKPNRRKVERPSKDLLAKLVWEKPTSQLSKEFNVSDVAIGKWCKSYQIVKPPRGYWTQRLCSS